MVLKDCSFGPIVLHGITRRLEMGLRHAGWGAVVTAMDSGYVLQNSSTFRLLWKYPVPVNYFIR